MKSEHEVNEKINVILRSIRENTDKALEAEQRNLIAAADQYYKMADLDQAQINILKWVLEWVLEVES